MINNENKEHTLFKESFELDSKNTHEKTHLDPLFTSNMVLQRDCPVVIHGKGNGHVSAEFDGKIYYGINKDAQFTVTLPSTPAGGPYTIKIFIDGTATLLENVMFGEVILLAGQSNAELPLEETDYPEENYNSNDRVRIYYVGQHFSEELHFKSILDNRWALLHKDEAKKWPSIAYHLGRRIESEKNIPVGIICVVRGASVIQSFMPPKVQKNFVFKPEELSANHPCNTKTDRYKFYNRQGIIYHSMFTKIVPYTVSSVIWYQGECNIGIGESKAYDLLLAAMIEKWRTDLNNMALPFIIVKIHNKDTNEGWLAVREAQERAARSISHCSIVDLDPLGICEDIHPKNKEDVSNLIFTSYYDN